MSQPDDDRALLDALLGPMAEQLRGVSLPLHILLEGRFGDLNDNQLEMIYAAQDAARSADQTLRLVARVQSLRDRRAPRDEPARAPIRVADLLRAPLLLASARAETSGGRVDAEIPPETPHVEVDRAALEEALSLILGEIVGTTAAGPVRLGCTHDRAAVRVAIRPGMDPATPSLPWTLAVLLLRDGGATLETSPAEARLLLPRAVFDARQS